MRPETCLFLNRKAVGRPEVDAAIESVRADHPELRVLVPWHHGENELYLREALERGATRFIAGGGDGTVNAIASLLVERDVDAYPVAEMGVLPLGTANDFARGCGLPSTDLEACLRIACAGEARPMDVGLMNGRPFVNVASAGYGAEVTATTPKDLKRALGGTAYSLVGVARSIRAKPYTGRLLVPGQPPTEGAMLFLAVGNRQYAGGGFEVGPLAKADDGLLDLAVVLAPRALDAIVATSELSDPTNPENEFVLYRQLAKFTLEFDRPLYCNLDGEPVRADRLAFEVLPGALHVVY